MADVTTTIAARPQPLGTFPLPAGYLLVPAGEDTEDARLALLAGRIPAVWPARMRAHELALADDRDGALAALTGDDAVSRFNRYVLDPDALDARTDTPTRARDPRAVAGLREELGELGALVDVVAFVLGRSDTPPALGDADGELAALILSAQAAHALGAGAPQAAIDLLERAAASCPCAEDVAGATFSTHEPLAGLMLGAAASIAQENGLEGAAPRFTRAIRLLDGADGLRVGRAELHLALAAELHGTGLVGNAIPHYHSALQLVLRDEAPELWAAAHANLAAAYLTMPMTEASDQLRLGVAVQSLRSALKVYTPETHPERWASTQLNLANSLVYTPSQHQADNLVEAVELYEAVLAVRDRHADPLGRARVLANQGNALAHLGMFDPAKAKLYEARFLFEEFDDLESVRSVRGVLDEISRQQALSATEALS
jgi:tetratricopeptide (TPR) repeat protein